MPESEYELVIIGGGPAGVTAGIYAARARVKALLIEKALIGGQVNYTERIDNYPGFKNGISSLELCQNFESQINELGLPVAQSEVKEIILKEKEKQVTLDGRTIASHALIVATGAVPNTLGVEGEERLTGRGVSYCATCDGPLFRNLRVAVVGGGDKALEEALFLSKFARDVFVIHRREAFRGVRILQEKALSEKNIRVVWNSIVEKIDGNQSVHSITLRDVKTQERKELSLDGVFIFIGIHPNSELLKDKVKLDTLGCIVTDDRMETSERGVFAAGDVRSKLLRQVTTAVGDGAQAAFSAQRYLDDLKTPNG
jgi:thioredoxin reductase (NADPH)